MNDELIKGKVVEKRRSNKMSGVKLEVKNKIGRRGVLKNAKE